MKFFLLGLSLLSLSHAQGAFDLRSLSADPATVKEDLERITEKTELKGKLSFERKESSADRVSVKCSGESIELVVEGGESWREVLYLGVQKLGFLFPHPRMQISPTFAEAKKVCGKTFSWRPAVKYSGFHLHTLHPSEWVHGFLLGKTEIATDFVRWLARNQQNIVDLSLLDMEEETIFKNLKAPFALAKNFGIHTGVVAGMAFHQQNHFKLISIFGSLFESLSLSQLSENLERLLKNVELSFINLEAGTSEFTPTRYDLSLKWMNRAAEIAEKKGVATLIKIHTSSNQADPEYGNFNFLPSRANTNVGVLPHTVFFYGIEDESAPMYGNKNFHHMRDFMLQEKDKRRTWFYPETSYFCVLDIDAPLFFTDYLLTRARDTAFLHKNGVQGQLNFSTGHELGYWLFDWSFALLNNLDYAFDPMIGLRLLGEDLGSWKRVIDFQHEYVNKKGVVSPMTFTSLGDEMLTGLHQTLKKNLMRDLKDNPKLLEEEISALSDAVENIPQDVTIKDPELQSMWEIFKLRLAHALAVRKAQASEETRAALLETAVELRTKASLEIEKIRKSHARYPEAKTFELHDNPTAYKWGYGYPAAEMQYWIREEEMVRQQKFSFYFMSQYSLWELLDGWVF